MEHNSILKYILRLFIFNDLFVIESTTLVLYTVHKMLYRYLLFTSQNPEFPLQRVAAFVTVLIGVCQLRAGSHVLLGTLPSSQNEADFGGLYHVTLRMSHAVNMAMKLKIKKKNICKRGSGKLLSFVVVVSIITNLVAILSSFFFLYFLLVSSGSARGWLRSRYLGCHTILLLASFFQ